MSSKAVKLSSAVVNSAEKYSKVFSRSVPKQIEHWAIIGKIAEENPDLTYDMIKDILISKEELNLGKVVEYTFGS